MTEKFSKSSRLLKQKDFRFRPFRKFTSKNFCFIFQTTGTGRLGISISKKVLKRATARNRVRRLLREAFRKNKAAFRGYDIHIIGLAPLTESWEALNLGDVRDEFERFHQKTKSKP